MHDTNTLALHCFGTLSSDSVKLAMEAVAIGEGLYPEWQLQLMRALVIPLNTNENQIGRELTADI